MRIPFAQIDAFSDTPFGGNQAAVMPLSAWLDDAVLMAPAMLLGERTTWEAVGNDSFRVTLTDPEQYDVVAAAVRDLPGVDQVVDYREFLDGLFRTLDGTDN